jgi:hypothetical protein
MGALRDFFDGYLCDSGDSEEIFTPLFLSLPPYHPHFWIINGRRTFASVGDVPLLSWFLIAIKLLQQ